VQQCAHGDLKDWFPVLQVTYTLFQLTQPYLTESSY